jgi:hypothetical protein
MRRVALFLAVLALVCFVAFSVADAAQGGGAKKAPPTPEEKFAQMDTNSDKAVNWDEFKAYAEKHAGKKHPFDEAKAKADFEKIAGTEKTFDLPKYKASLEKKGHKKDK